MNKYKYVPDYEIYWNKQHIDAFNSGYMGSIRVFFNLPEIQELVKKDDWLNVFNKWQDLHYNPQNHSDEILAFFLYHYCGIEDFLKNFSKKQISEKTFWFNSVVEED